MNQEQEAVVPAEEKKQAWIKPVVREMRAGEAEQTSNSGADGSGLS